MLERCELVFVRFVGVNEIKTHSCWGQYHSNRHFRDYVTQ